MLNTRCKEETRVFYSYSACFVQRATGHTLTHTTAEQTTHTTHEHRASLFCEYVHLEYERIRVICRVKHAEYGVHILVVAPQEYANLCATCRTVSSQALDPEMMLPLSFAGRGAAV